MPARKKTKPATDVWVIKCDGLRVCTADTKAEAKSMAKELQKTLPTYMNFSFEVTKQEPAHSTTA